MSELVFVTGANSAVGCALLRRAGLEGARIIACVRSQRAAAELPSCASAARIEVVPYTEVDAMVAAMEGARSVVHLPGVLVERAGSTYLDANVLPVRAVVAAARRAHLEKFVLVSAIGADASSPNRYYASKGSAEACVRQSGLEYTLLRAPLLLGQGTEGEAALLREIARPAPRLLGGGRTLQQPLAAGDLALGALRACRAGVAAGRTLDLVGPESLAYRALVERAGRLAGRSIRPRSSPVPVWLLRHALALRSRLFGPGFSRDALDVIMDSHALDPEPAARELGIQLTALDAVLRDMIEREVSA